MQLIMFSKMLKEKSIEQLAELGNAMGLDGFDMAVREGYPVNPDNVGDALPQAMQTLRQVGLDIPMVTGEGGLLEPDDPAARPILGAMAEAGVRFLKLGYFRVKPGDNDYWSQVDRVRRAFEGWQKLAAEYEVKVCYHTHSNRCMGLNAGCLMHLLHDFDPTRLGAYIDTAHLRTEGEEFALAVDIVRPYLSVVAVKDAMLVREEKDGHGSTKRTIVPAGQGMCDFTAVFQSLDAAGFDGPVSVHCEFECEGDEFLATARREAAFFRRHLDALG